ncbi:MAG: membrane protein [Halioglobus sp.]|jgi:membrane protein
MEFMLTYLRRIWRRCHYLFTRLRSDRCSENAAALTYMSLFALVPLMTVLYTMASAVPAFQGVELKIEAFMFENLVPETSSEIQEYLGDFSRQAKNLTGFGIAFLVITAVIMLRNIEKSFNQIWRTRENRSSVSSFLLYWAVLSLAPVTVGLALGISTYLTSFANMMVSFDVIGIGDYLLKLAPIMLNTAGFTLIYAAVPNCAVPLRHALIGGFVAAVVFNIARSLFTQLVVGSSYTFIYGAFAAVPLFLLWIYLSWIIVLTGAILVHSLSAYQSQEQATRPNVLKALDILYLFWINQKSGTSVNELDIFKEKHEVTKDLGSETWSALRDLFLEKKLISQSERGEYLLSRDLHSITFWQLKEWVNKELPLNEKDNLNHLSWQLEAYSLLRGQRVQQRDALNLSLAELFEK